MNITSRLVPPAVIDVLAASECAEKLGYTIKLCLRSGGGSSAIRVTSAGEEPLAWSVEVYELESYADQFRGYCENPSLGLAFVTATTNRARQIERLAEARLAEAKRYRREDRKRIATETAVLLTAAAVELRVLAQRIGAAWPEEVTL